MVRTGADDEPGINGGLLKRAQPGHPVVNTLSVTSLDDYTARVSEKGGEIVVPKMAIPDIGWLAYFKDTEGNIFGLMQEDPGAE